MTVGELSVTCSTDELAYWQAVSAIESDERKRAELAARARSGAAETTRKLRNG